jgi:hypothetical protein
MIPRAIMVAAKAACPALAIRIARPSVLLEFMRMVMRRILQRTGRQCPETRPAQSKRSPAPLFHAATQAVRTAFWEAYATFVAAFREASERLREGDRMARFPMGSFPPGLPFVVAKAVGPP